MRRSWNLVSSGCNIYTKETPSFLPFIPFPTRRMVLFWSWIGLASLGFVQAQTLYEVVLPIASLDVVPESDVATGSEAKTFSISVGGVGADGMTTYVEEGTVTALLNLQNGLVSTVNTDPSPFTNTFEQDASSMRFGSNDGSDTYGACTYAPNGNAGCVYVAPDITTTFTLTTSGFVVPFFTINAAAAPTTTPSNTAAASGPSSSAHSNDARAAFKFSAPLTTIAIVLPALLFFVSL
ncbi:hypothetical protein B0H11DRAFT_11461 [Mycena galericulata]|nr:hypothetical protein B0H11DRAFT_11461 [Mycena galericulata]